jgi:hypothetical protein
MQPPSGDTFGFRLLLLMIGLALFGSFIAGVDYAQDVLPREIVVDPHQTDVVALFITCASTSAPSVTVSAKAVIPIKTRFAIPPARQNRNRVTPHACNPTHSSRSGYPVFRGILS